jgi:hypothetical protein
MSSQKLQLRENVQYVAQNLSQPKRIESILSLLHSIILFFKKNTKDSDMLF